jgi:Flp pilus assembly protein TadD
VLSDRLAPGVRPTRQRSVDGAEIPANTPVAGSLHINCSAMPVTRIARVTTRAAASLLLTLLVAACSQESPTPAAPAAPALAATPDYVGSDECLRCHSGEFEAWQSSHHALAMQHANAETVLGDFSGVSYDYFGTISTFFERDGTYYVRTDNADGDLEEFAISYTFGVTPLQQYLVEFPGGRLQTLPLAWDSRPAADGGQRWYHVYPDEQIAHGDRLHWTGREQNWNYMCAECHSTELLKNYTAETDSFDTTWSEISVGCEACHGPASRHVAEADAGSFTSRAGLLTDLDDAGRAVWEMNPATGIAGRSEPRMRPPTQPEACGRCHSRRSVLTSDYEYDRPLMDTHLPSLLDDRLYFPDGQILDEVYVYGSFVQSRMYQAGVSCSDCHDPHSATLRTGSEPSAICATCHLPATFDVTAHHRHPDGSVDCVDCHMTSRDYMVVDGRRDHSFRVPRPDLTAAIGSPNACNQCHADRDTDWAVTAFRDWFGDDLPAHYGVAIHAGRAGGANSQVSAAAANQAFPGIARGTALTLLRPPYSEPVARTIRDALGSGDPFVRLGALRALSGLQQDLQVDWATPLLSDPVRAIRIEAAQAIAPFRGIMHPRFEAGMRAAEQELLDSLRAIEERAEAQINLGNYYLQTGNTSLSEAALRRAMRLAPDEPGARVNLADLYRVMGRDEDAEQLLRDGVTENPDDATYRHSLGLLLVRRQQPEAALEELEAAFSLAPDNPRFAYVYAVALNSLGRSDEAISFLQDVSEKFAGDFDVQWALATMLRDQGRNEESRQVATRLAEIYPGIPPVQNLLGTL